MRQIPTTQIAKVILGINIGWALAGLAVGGPSVWDLQHIPPKDRAGVYAIDTIAVMLITLYIWLVYNAWRSINRLREQLEDALNEREKTVLQNTRDRN